MCALIVDVTRFTKPTSVCSIFKPVVKNLRVHGLFLRYSAWKAFILFHMLQIYFKQQKQTPLSSWEEFVLQYFSLTMHSLLSVKKRYFSRSKPHCSWGVRIVWIGRAGDKNLGI